MSWEAGIMMAGVGILWYLAILLINMDETHIPMKLFLLLISVWYTVALVNLGIQFAIENSASNTIVHSISILYLITVWIARVVSTYYALYFLFWVFDYTRNQFKKSRWGNQ